MRDIYTADFTTKSFTFKNYLNLDFAQQKTILENRNAGEIRIWMTNQTPISLDDHLAFIRGLKDCKSKIYYACFYNGEMIGSFCLNPFNEKQSGEVGSYLFPKWIGLGVGTRAKSEFCRFFLDECIVNCILAKVKHDNSRNIHVNERIGFKKYSADDEYVYMKLEL